MLTILTFKQKNGQDRKVSFRGTGWIFYYTKIQPVRSVLAILRDLLLYVPVPWSAQHGQTPTPGKWQLWCSIEPQNSDCPEQLKDTRRSFRMRHYFLEWSLCHAFTCISCGLFVKDPVIPQHGELGRALRMSGLKPFLPPAHHLPAGCLKKWLRTCFQLLVLCREVWFMRDIGYTCENTVFF